MDMIEPGKESNFKVDFTPKIVYATLYDILKQFKDLNINKFIIDIYGFTCMNSEVGLSFENDNSEWSPESLNLERIENILAVLSEHENKFAWFNVLFWKV
jgi:hypothetical protein